MPTTPRQFRIHIALLAVALLAMGSAAMLSASSRATDLTAIAGGTGLVVASGLLVLSLLVAWWQHNARRYVVSEPAAAEREAHAEQELSRTSRAGSDAATG